MVFDSFREKIGKIGLGSDEDELITPSNSGIINETAKRVSLNKKEVKKSIEKSDEVLEELLYPILVKLSNNGNPDDHDVGERPFSYVIEETENTLVLGGGSNVFVTVADILNLEGNETKAVRTAHKLAAVKNGFEEHTMMDDVVVVPKPEEPGEEAESEIAEKIEERAKKSREEKEEKEKREKEKKQDLEKEEEKEEKEQKPEREKDTEPEKDEEDKREKKRAGKPSNQNKKTTKEKTAKKETPENKRDRKTKEPRRPSRKSKKAKDAIDNIFDDISSDSSDESTEIYEDLEEEEKEIEEYEDLVYEVICDEKGYRSRMPRPIYKKIMGLSEENQVDLGIDLRVEDGSIILVIKSSSEGKMKSVIQGEWLWIPEETGAALLLEEKGINWRIENEEIRGEIQEDWSEAEEGEEGETKEKEERDEEKREISEIERLIKTSVRRPGGLTQEVKVHLPSEHSRALGIDDGDNVTLSIISKEEEMVMVVTSGGDEEKPNVVAVKDYGAVTKQINFPVPKKIAQALNFHESGSVEWGIEKTEDDEERVIGMIVEE